MRLQLLREQEKQFLSEQKKKQEEYQRYKEIKEKKKKIKELYQQKLLQKEKLEKQKEQIQLNYQKSLQEIQNNKNLEQEKQIQQHKRKVQIEANNILREKQAYEFLKQQQQKNFEQRNRQKLLKQNAINKEKERTEKILKAYQLKKKNKRKYIIKNQFENQEQLIEKYKNQNSRLGFKFFKENDEKNAFEYAEQEEINKQKQFKEKEAIIIQTQKRAQQSIKQMIQQRDQNEKEAIQEYYRIEQNLIKLQQDKEEQFAKNQRVIIKKKQKIFKERLNKEYLPELERINKILIKKNFKFLDDISKKRQCFYMLKDNLFKIDEQKDNPKINNIDLNYTQSDKEIIFDITQSKDQIQQDFSEIKSIDIKDEIQHQSNSSFGNLSDFDIKTFLEQEQKFLDDLNNSTEIKKSQQKFSKNPPKNFKKKNNQQNKKIIETNENLIKEKIENKFGNLIENSVIQEEQSEEISYSLEKPNLDTHLKNSSQKIKIKDVIDNQYDEQQKIRELLNKHNVSISDDSDDERHNDFQQDIYQYKTQVMNEQKSTINNISKKEDYDVNITVKKKDKDLLQKKKELLEKRKNYKPKMFQKKRKSKTKNKQLLIYVIIQLFICLLFSKQIAIIQLLQYEQS